MHKHIKKICPKCFDLIGDKTRMKILYYLSKKSGNVKEIGERFSLTQPTISHHLAVLKAVGLLESKKTGRENVYSLNKKYCCKKCNLLKTPFKV